MPSGAHHRRRVGGLHNAFQVVFTPVEYTSVVPVPSKATPITTTPATKAASKAYSTAFNPRRSSASRTATPVTQASMKLTIIANV